VRFALDGVEYEIDLSEENARTLRGQLEPYIQRSRVVGGAQPGQQRRTVAGRENSEAVRNWAKANGFVVSDRGRIPTTVAPDRLSHSRLCGIGWPVSIQTSGDSRYVHL
jgi:hypothetical protein